VLRDAVAKARNISLEGTVPEELMEMARLAERSHAINSEAFRVAMKLSGSS
jgi:hypothetical protein